MPHEAEKRELQEKLEKFVKKRFDGDSQAAFDYYASRNRTGTGNIGKTELVEFLSDAKIGNWITRGQWADAILAELDTDQDGSLSWNELKSVLK